jgi:hypothetical protein
MKLFEVLRAGIGGGSESLEGPLAPVSASLDFFFVFQRFIVLRGKMCLRTPN